MELPQGLAHAVRAINTADVGAFLDAFGPSAVVQDDGERFRGRTGLVEWFALNAIAGVQVCPIALRCVRGRHELRTIWRCAPFNDEPIAFDVTMSAFIDHDRLRLLEITSLP